jgi:hypothetical protein
MPEAGIFKKYIYLPQSTFRAKWQTNKKAVPKEVDQTPLWGCFCIIDVTKKR